MTSYNKHLIKQDLIIIKNWTKNTNWKELKKQLYTIIKTNYNSKYSLNQSNYDIYLSISRLSQILKSDELFQLIKDLNKLYYNKNKYQDSLIGGYNYDALHGGLNIGKFASKFKSSASALAKKAKTQVAEQGKQMAQETKQYAQQQAQQVGQYAQQQAQQVGQYAQQQAQQMADQAKQYAQQQAQQAQQYAQQQAQQLAQQAQQYAQQQTQNLQNTIQQVGQTIGQNVDQRVQQAQIYVKPYIATQGQITTPMPTPGINPGINQGINPVMQGISYPPLPVAMPPQLPIPAPALEASTENSGLLTSIFDSAGSIGKKIMGL